MADVTDFFKATKPEVVFVPKRNKNDIDRVRHPKVVEFLENTPILATQLTPDLLTEEYKAYLLSTQMPGSEVDKHIETFKEHRIDTHMSVVTGLLTPMTSDIIGFFIIETMGKLVLSPHRVLPPKDDTIIDGPSSMFVIAGNEPLALLSLYAHSDFTAKETRFSEPEKDFKHTSIVDDVQCRAHRTDTLKFCHPKHIKTALSIFENMAIMLNGNIIYTKEESLNVFTFSYLSDPQHLIHLRMGVSDDTYHITFKSAVCKE